MSSLFMKTTAVWLVWYDFVILRLISSFHITNDIYLIKYWKYIKFLKIYEINLAIGGISHNIQTISNNFIIPTQLRSVKVRKTASWSTVTNSDFWPLIFFFFRSKAVKRVKLE